MVAKTKEVEGKDKRQKPKGRLAFTAKERGNLSLALAPRQLKMSNSKMVKKIGSLLLGAHIYRNKAEPWDLFFISES
jgi:hypothetical protein